MRNLRGLADQGNGGCPSVYGKRLRRAGCSIVPPHFPTGSLSGGARALGLTLTQPTIGRSIDELDGRSTPCPRALHGTPRWPACVYGSRGLLSIRSSSMARIRT